MKLKNEVIFGELIVTQKEILNRNFHHRIYKSHLLAPT